MSKKTMVIWVGAVVLLVSFAVAARMKSLSYERQINALRNKIAEEEKTIEISKGVYEKMATQKGDLIKLLDTKDEQLRSLRDEVRKNHEQILTVTSLVMKWKKSYLATIKGTQTEVVLDGKTRHRVDFKKDFGYVIVDGHTLTDPPEATVQVRQGHPLRVTLAISQKKDQSWVTRATSSDDNMSIDVAVSSVDPYVILPKWYEKIGVDTEIGVGDGVLGGLGISYEIGKFDVGPRVWLVASDHVGRFFGAGLTWHPFRK